MGTAETPAAPISGLIFSFVNRFMPLAKSTPPAVAMQKAATPRAKMKSDSSDRKAAACVLAPTENPSRMVTMSIIEVRAVLASRSVTPHSLSRLPKKSMPTSTMESGAIMAAMIKAPMGKRIFSRCETARGGAMRMSRSCRVVKSRMMGGWMMGTRAM